MELKDLPYFFGSKSFGDAGHKLESGYYDGSGTQMSVLSVPSVIALSIFLEVVGFDDLHVVLDPEVYARPVPAQDRSFSAVYMTAVLKQDTIGTSKWVEAYEYGLCGTLLPTSFALALYRVHCQHEDR